MKYVQQPRTIDGTTSDPHLQYYTTCVNEIRIALKIAALLQKPKEDAKVDQALLDIILAKNRTLLITATSNYKSASSNSEDIFSIIASLSSYRLQPQALNALRSPKAETHNMTTSVLLLHSCWILLKKLQLTEQDTTWLELEQKTMEVLKTFLDRHPAGTIAFEVLFTCTRSFFEFYDHDKMKPAMEKLLEHFNAYNSPSICKVHRPEQQLFEFMKQNGFTIDSNDSPENTLQTLKHSNYIGLQLPENHPLYDIVKRSYLYRGKPRDGDEAPLYGVLGSELQSDPALIDAMDIPEHLLLGSEFRKNGAITILVYKESDVLSGNTRPDAPPFKLSEKPLQDEEKIEFTEDHHLTLIIHPQKLLANIFASDNQAKLTTNQHLDVMLRSFRNSIMTTYKDQTPPAAAIEQYKLLYLMACRFLASQYKESMLFFTENHQDFYRQYHNHFNAFFELAREDFLTPEQSREILTETLDLMIDVMVTPKELPSEEVRNQQIQTAIESGDTRYAQELELHYTQSLHALKEVDSLPVASIQTMNDFIAIIQYISKISKSEYAALAFREAFRTYAALIDKMETGPLKSLALGFYYYTIGEYLNQLLAHSPTLPVHIDTQEYINANVVTSTKMFMVFAKAAFGAAESKYREALIKSRDPEMEIVYSILFRIENSLATYAILLEGAEIYLKSMQQAHHLSSLVSTESRMYIRRLYAVNLRLVIQQMSGIWTWRDITHFARAFFFDAKRSHQGAAIVLKMMQRHTPNEYAEVTKEFMFAFKSLLTKYIVEMNEGTLTKKLYGALVFFVQQYPQCLSYATAMQIGEDFLVEAKEEEKHETVAICLSHFIDYFIDLTQTPDKANWSKAMLALEMGEFILRHLKSYEALAKSLETPTQKPIHLFIDVLIGRSRDYLAIIAAGEFTEKNGPDFAVPAIGYHIALCLQKAYEMFPNHHHQDVSMGDVLDYNAQFTLVLLETLRTRNMPVHALLDYPSDRFICELSADRLRQRLDDILKHPSTPPTSYIASQIVKSKRANTVAEQKAVMNETLDIIEKYGPEYKNGTHAKMVYDTLKDHLAFIYLTWPAENGESQEIERKLELHANEFYKHLSPIDKINVRHFSAARPMLEIAELSLKFTVLLEAVTLGYRVLLCLDACIRTARKDGNFMVFAEYAREQITAIKRLAESSSDKNIKECIGSIYTDLNMLLEVRHDPNPQVKRNKFLAYLKKKPFDPNLLAARKLQKIKDSDGILISFTTILCCHIKKLLMNTAQVAMMGNMIGYMGQEKLAYVNMLEAYSHWPQEDTFRAFTFLMLECHAKEMRDLYGVSLMQGGDRSGVDSAKIALEKTTKDIVKSVHAALRKLNSKDAIELHATLRLLEVGDEILNVICSGHCPHFTYTLQAVQESTLLEYYNLLKPISELLKEMVHAAERLIEAKFTDSNHPLPMYHAYENFLRIMHTGHVGQMLKSARRVAELSKNQDSCFTNSCIRTLAYYLSRPNILTIAPDYAHKEFTSDLSRLVELCMTKKTMKSADYKYLKAISTIEAASHDAFKKQLEELTPPQRILSTAATQHSPLQLTSTEEEQSDVMSILQVANPGGTIVHASSAEQLTELINLVSQERGQN